MLHAKVITIDGELAIVGSTNLNRRSLRLDEEVDLVAFDAAVAAELDRHTDDDLTRCELVDPAEMESADRRLRGPLRLLSGLIERWT